MKVVKKAKGSIKEFWQNFIQVLRRTDMIFLPGNLSFFFFLALIPTLGLISYGASFLNLSTDFLYNFLARSFSREVADVILGVDFVNNAHFIITVIFGLYIASNGADSMITASNAIYGIENKSWIKRRLKALGLLFLIMLLLIFMLIVPVFGNTITSLIKEVNINTSITNQILYIFDLLKGPISWLIIFVIIRVIYAIAPDRPHKNRVINYGAIFTTVGWIVVTKIYSSYVTNYANYTALYGGFASIVVLMIWIYFLSYIFTIGIALNSRKDEINLTKTATINLENE